ncbi:Histone-lysine N-methyltransferase, H3 lysine-36 specific [Lecanosticta acicola]|uniref:Histone-lysine N-methyltransferase, H3 lysine-36 specific n=1 Tax=Lecanosticta acicola TaxID=111012 RepID=A0AAI8W1E7_9PEZI|nr:Histone-lysine N-methyltransferase, H3 lysine-36 specific [Lecanosticta acicola]
MTRAASSESSIGSNIIVSPGKSNERGSEQPSASTPPTSVSDNHSMQSSKVTEESGRRSRRARRTVSYHVKELSEKQLPTEMDGSGTGSRKASGLSGRTLVNRKNDHADEEDVEFGEEVDKALKPDWEIPADSPKGKLPARPTRKPSIRDRARNAAGKMTTALGKRTRDMMENGKRALGLQKEKESPQKNKLLKELDTGTRGVLDEMDLDDPPILSPRPSKRAKTNGRAPAQTLPPATAPTGPLQKTSDGKKVKKWQNEGLYVGQEADFDTAKNPKKLQKKRPASAMSEAESGPPAKKPFMPLPMFSYLENKRPFTIPYDVFAPSLKKGDERPKDWQKLNRNRLIGEAKDVWEKEERLPQSACVCRKPAGGELGCDYDCLNRVMQYECNEENCNLDPLLCSNRPFAQLGERIKKGGSFDVGVEVVKTEKRGFGIRACRSFEPGQIIMEYTGEIISEAECQRRMLEVYKGKQNYYLMELERNLVIDGTKGSMARFINHSCDPNCEVRMLKVNGTPRMAVFAGESGIMTGEELTYDYNFDSFGDSRQDCYCGAKNCRGSLSKRLNAAEMKKMLKEETERKRKEVEEAQRKAAEEAKKKAAKAERPSGWVGWLDLNDPANLERMREEKRQKAEAEKNSSRAQRLASRRGSTSAVVEAPKEEKEKEKKTASKDSPKKKSPKKESPKKEAKPSGKRRKTVHTVQEVRSRISSKVTMDPETGDVYVHESDDSDMEELAAPRTSKQLRRTSTGSRFTEDLELEQRPASRPGSRHSTRGIMKRTAFSVKSSMEVQRNAIAEDETMPLVSSALAEQLNGGEGRSMSKVTGGRSKGKQRASFVEEDVDANAGAEEDEDAEEGEEPASKRKSLLETVTNAVKNGRQRALGRANSTGGGKLRQSTLNFPRVS